MSRREDRSFPEATCLYWVDGDGNKWRGEREIKREVETGRGTLRVAMATAGDTSPVSPRNQFTVNQHREALSPASIRDKS